MLHGLEAWDNKWSIDNCVKVSSILDLYLDLLNTVDLNPGTVMQ